MSNTTISTEHSDGLKLRTAFSIIPEWVIDAEISHGAVRLYVVLARYANNDNYTAYPGRQTLANRLRVSTKTVDRFIKELVGIQALSVEHRKVETKDGKLWNQSNMYTIEVAPPVSPPPEGTDTSVPRGMDNGVPRGRDVSVAQNYTHLELDPKNYKTSECFELFWIEYDKKVGKKKAQDQWNKNVKDKATAELVIRAAKSQRISTEAKYRTDPERWLRDHRWLDESVSAISTKSSIDRFKNYADTRGLTDREQYQ